MPPELQNPQMEPPSPLEDAHQGKIGTGRSKILFFVLAIIAIAVVASTLYITKSKNEVTQTEQSAKKSDQNLISIVDIVEEGAPHIVADQKILRKYTEEVLVDSVKDVLAKSNRNPNLLLRVFAEPNDSNFIFLQEFLNASDSPHGSLYSLDINTGELAYLSINNLFDNFQTAGKSGLSPDQVKIFLIPYSKKGDGGENLMYLIDLQSDSYKELVRLPTGQTFNAGFDSNNGCWLDCPSYFEIKWKDQNTITYTVYDQNKKPIEPKNPFDFVYRKDYQESIFLKHEEIRVY